MSGETLRLYGLRIRTELPLHQGRRIDDTGEYDVDLTFGPPMATSGNVPPPGRVLVHVEIDRPYLTCTESADGYVVRFYGTCDFIVARDLRQVSVQMADGGDVAMAAVYAAGTFVSFLLALRGAPVLHASAVQIGDLAVAFVGRSGMGKSTIAALMCADGAALVTDDVLRLDMTGARVSCHLGATELRLRKSAEELSARFDQRPGIRRTVDRRSALSAPPARRDELPLAAIVIPFPDRENTTCELTRLAAMEAALMLTRFPRVLGWEDPDVLQQQFEHVADIVERVPVFTARVPWGPPFAPDIAAQIRDAIGVGTPEEPLPAAGQVDTVSCAVSDVVSDAGPR